MASSDRLAAPVLDALGLAPGDRVRFCEPGGGRPEDAVVLGGEPDGSVRLRDGRGAIRSVPPGRLEVRTTGPRGAARWEPVLERARRPRQLGLW